MFLAHVSNHHPGLKVLFPCDLLHLSSESEPEISVGDGLVLDRSVSGLESCSESGQVLLIF